MKHPSQIRIIEPFVIFLVIGAAIIYLVNALNTGNWLWFQAGSTDVRPARIVIVDHGQRTIVAPGHAEFNALADAASASLSEFSNSDLVSIGLSTQTLDEYANESLVLELYFDAPLHFNLLVRTGEPTQLLIPIEGRHADGGYVFRGAQGEWWFGALRMADPAPLYAALQQMGYRAAVFQESG
jgi:hypothetical protein